MTDKAKSAAPALERGIEVIRLLEKEGEMNLETISLKLKAPKSSMTRILDTLVKLGIVIRSNATRKYKPLQILTSTEKGSERLEQLASVAVRELARQLNETIEWYIWHEGAMTISDRAEAENKTVNVRARLGFRRDPFRELEAVNRFAYGWNLVDSSNLEGICISREGKMVPLSSAESEALIRQAAGSRAAMDENYNANGVRRYAAVVLDQQGGLLGVLALAESFRPGDDTHRQQYLKILVETAEDLTKKMN